MESLVKAADARIAHLVSQPVTAENVSFIIEGYYEAIKELLTAILLARGLRSSNHQCLISFFYNTYKQHEAEARFIARLSFLRNRLNYYGELIDPAFYEQHKTEIDKVIKLLKSLLITMAPEKSMEKIFLYSSLTRKKELFKPLKKGEVRVYTCGPTVYWYQHIGNLRTYVFSDLLKRVLLHNNYKVKHIINITDVGHLTSDADEGEDKMELAAKKEGRSAQAITKQYFDIFHHDLKKLNVLEPDKWVKATEHIKEQIALIQTLENKGFTYKTRDGIYFDTSRLKDYGMLAGIRKEGIQAGKRVKVGEKKSKTDFALWKFSEGKGKRQQEWESPWGIGFPGWHLECSAMSMKYFGEHFDIHTGGEDLRQIHHTNEIAQSEAATGKKFVNYWLHGAFLLDKEGRKVSKSTGGLFTLSELEEQDYSPMYFRYLCLQTHYRKPLAFSFDALDAAKATYERVKRKVSELRKTETKGKDKRDEYEPHFHAAINDDLNIPEALQVFLKTLDDETFDSKKKIALLEHFDTVLGLGITEMQEVLVLVPPEVQHLIVARERLRKAKKWAEADVLRQRILERGFKIEDTPEGVRVERA